MKNLMVWFVNQDSTTRGAVLALAGVIGAALITGIFSVITTVLGKSKKSSKENSTSINQTIGTNNGNQILVNGDYNETSNALSAEDASKIAIGLFMDNFPKLQVEARKVAKERADEFCQEVMDKLQKCSANDYSVFKEPDTQYILYEAQKNYARFGTKEMLETLTNLVSKRVEYNKETVLKVSLDKAIEIAPMISQGQLDYLSMLFLCSRVKFDNIKTIEELKQYLELIVQKFDGADFNSSEYLNILGCLQITLLDIIDVLSETYGLNKKDVDKICPDILRQLEGDYSTSYVGTVLAIINAQQKTGFDLKMETWIQ